MTDNSSSFKAESETAFRVAETKTEDLINRIRAISNVGARREFLCNYMALLASLERRVGLNDHVVAKRS